MEYIIRRATRKDSKDIAHVVTLGWNQTYKGLVPEFFLEHLKENEDERAKKMQEHFDEEFNNQLVLEVDKKIVGFVRYGKCDDEDYKGIGEIFALYIIDGYKCYGFGKKLVDEAIKYLKEDGYKDMVICCLVGNPSNEFYKHIGGKFVKTTIFKRLALPENMYLFKNI